MKRPLGTPCVLFIAGILLAEYSGWPFTIFLFFGLCSVLTALLWRKRRQVALGVGILIAGGAALALQTREIPSHDLRNAVGGEPRIATVRGQLVEAPYQRFYDDRSRSLTKMECAEFRFKDAEWQPVAGTIAVVTPGAPPEHLWHGQIVEVTGVLASPPTALAPGLFDYQAYLGRLGIHYTLRTLSANDWQVLGSTHPPLAVRFSAWAKRTLAYGLPVEDEALQLLWAMTLGWKTALNGETAEPFMRSGTLHVFAISGLHIAMIAAIIAGVLRAIGVRRAYCAAIVIPIIWFYTYATGWQASAVRSAVMASVVFGSWILVRPPDMFNSLAAAALIILAVDPQQLFQAGFQLSFAVVFCLALFGSFFRFLQDLIASGDPLIPWEVRPWWQRQWLTVVRCVTGFAITAIAAWLASIPLTAYYFHLFSPVSVLANLLVVPMSGLALASNLASIFFGAWFPAATDILNNSAWFWMKAMLWVSEWTARWPGAALHVSAPGPFAITLYYVALVAWTGRLFSRAQLRPWLWAVIATLAIGSSVETIRKYSRSTLTVLPLSGGHAVFVDLPGTADDMLVDCGGEDTARITVKPFLQSRGVQQLPHLVLTHGDADHVGGFETIDDFFEPQKVFAPAVKFKSPFFRKALQLAEERGRALEQLPAGSTVARWSVLYPDSDNELPLADDRSLVLRGAIHGTQILLMPDLSSAAQKILIERDLDLRSDIVISSMPLTGEPLSDPLLDLIQPRVIVLADALYPPDARARPPLRERLSRRGIPVFYASETGAVTVDFSAGAAVVRPTVETEFRKPVTLRVLE